MFWMLPGPRHRCGREAGLLEFLPPREMSPAWDCTPVPRGAHWAPPTACSPPLISHSRSPTQGLGGHTVSGTATQHDSTSHMWLLMFTPSKNK